MPFVEVETVHSPAVQYTVYDMGGLGIPEVRCVGCDGKRDLGFVCLFEVQITAVLISRG